MAVALSGVSRQHNDKIAQPACIMCPRTAMPAAKRPGPGLQNLPACSAQLPGTPPIKQQLCRHAPTRLQEPWGLHNRQHPASWPVDPLSPHCNPVRPPHSLTARPAGTCSSPPSQNPWAAGPKSPHICLPPTLPLSQPVPRAIAPHPQPCLPPATTTHQDARNHTGRQLQAVQAVHSGSTVHQGPHPTVGCPVSAHPPGPLTGRWLRSRCASRMCTSHSPLASWASRRPLMPRPCRAWATLHCVLRGRVMSSARALARPDPAAPLSLGGRSAEEALPMPHAYRCACAGHPGFRARGEHHEQSCGRGLVQATCVRLGLRSTALGEPACVVSTAVTVLGGAVWERGCRVSSLGGRAAQLPAGLQRS